MNDEIVTTDLILEAMKGYVTSKQQIPPSLWLDAASKLVVLIGDENDKLFELQQKVAETRKRGIEAGDSVAKSKVMVEAMDCHKEMRKQEAKIEQIWEFVRIAKKRASLTETEFKGY